MIKFSLPDDHPLVVSLGRHLAWLRSSDVPARATGKPGPELDEDHLNAIVNGKTSHCYRSKYSDFDYDFKEIEKHSTKVYEEKTNNTNYDLIPTSKTYYPENGGYLDWHLDADGDRLYSTWADGESYFRIRDTDTGEIVTSYDDPNKWTFRIFAFDAKNPLWHCVYAKNMRLSIGYRFVLP